MVSAGYRGLDPLPDRQKTGAPPIVSWGGKWQDIWPLGVRLKGGKIKGVPQLDRSNWAQTELFLPINQVQDIVGDIRQYCPSHRGKSTASTAQGIWNCQTKSWGCLTEENIPRANIKNGGAPRPGRRGLRLRCCQNQDGQENPHHGDKLPHKLVMAKPKTPGIQGAKSEHEHFTFSSANLLDVKNRNPH